MIASLASRRRLRAIRQWRLGAACAALLAPALAGCGTTWIREPLAEAPVVTTPSPTDLNLETLPPPARKIDVAIYSFPDLTGQNKPNDNIAEYSRAVTQGGGAFVVDALRRAGGGRWFSVVERTGLANLLQERQLIRATRQEFEGTDAKPLPPIRFAGLIVEGGIIGYDANTVTGGAGANLLGIGGDTRYRRDEVTVAMRIVSVQTGEVLNSVTVTKTIYSVGLNANAYRYVAVAKLLQVEAGVTRNEPTQMAVREAIDLAVYATILEGARKKLWRFRDPTASSRLIEDYLMRDKPTPLAQPESVPVADRPVVAKS
ncbi:curli production assembly/transport component CsgG [Methylobacterium sp. 174MFSha1.1]|uniref:CsgG/HfaB family protein n=1 Tax=Methylobacterium sp. 174MFSha1.1 TaxID=1502749 RepID=UPI0008F331B1|nr:CsgG/HfaB family protein [Methylobacterium sp. 174MFSha1.1]SFV03646.1 curli production assembly/transport component CsgG [Methylobacterium sp. 174MFSha1.1]